jgi:hypothetical protein
MFRVTDETGGWNGRGGIAGGIFTAWSADGLRWQKVKTACVDLGTDANAFDHGMVSEPCISVLPDGRARLWYECCDRVLGDEKAAFYILSATSPQGDSAAASL